MKMNNVWILAQAGDKAPFDVTGTPVTEEGEAKTLIPSDPNAPTAGRTPQKSPLINFLPFILILVVMYFLLLRGPRKKQQQHKQMVQGLQKNDKVRTIGGIIGTVVEIKDDEITLKVDESNNTKIKIATSAIGKNLSKD